MGGLTGVMVMVTLGMTAGWAENADAGAAGGFQRAGAIEGGEDAHRAGRILLAGRIGVRAGRLNGMVHEVHVARWH